MNVRPQMRWREGAPRSHDDIIVIRRAGMSAGPTFAGLYGATPQVVPRTNGSTGTSPRIVRTTRNRPGIRSASRSVPGADNQSLVRSICPTDASPGQARSARSIASHPADAASPASGTLVGLALGSAVLAGSAQAARTAGVVLEPIWQSDLAGCDIRVCRRTLT